MQMRSISYTRSRNNRICQSHSLRSPARNLPGFLFLMQPLTSYAFRNTGPTVLSDTTLCATSYSTTALLGGSTAAFLQGLRLPGCLRIADDGECRRLKGTEPRFSPRPGDMHDAPVSREKKRNACPIILPKAPSPIPPPHPADRIPPRILLSPPRRSIFLSDPACSIAP